MEINGKTSLKKINEEGWYWAEGVEVMGNYGDTNTFTFCMCRNYQEAKRVATGLNLIDKVMNEE